MQLQTTYNQNASRHYLKKDNGGSGSTVLAYQPIILSVSTYSSFGAPLEDGSTNWSNESYRYGFNGMEKDDEIKGAGNSYDFGARIYDPRLGRWLSINPLISIQTFTSGYSLARNSPIYLIDINGILGGLIFRETKPQKETRDSDGKKIVSEVVVRIQSRSGILQKIPKAIPYSLHGLQVTLLGLLNKLL